MRIAVANLKGGPDKTTTSVALAELLAETGDTFLVDADPQMSATAWADDAAEAGSPLSSTVVGMASRDLARLLVVTIDLAQDLGTPMAVLLSQTRTGTRLLDDAHQALDALEYPCLASDIPLREVIAAADGRPTSETFLAFYRPVLDELAAALADTEGALA